MKNLIAWDTETYPIMPGILAPKIVIGSRCNAYRRPTHIQDNDMLVLQCADGTSVLAGANIAYDFCCLLGEEPTLFPAVWKLYEEGRVHDVLIAATLNAIAEGRIRETEGHAGNDLYFRDGSRAFDPSTRGLRDHYSLSMCVYESLGRSNAKENDEWKLRYHELDGVPLADWPKEALQYPLDDALNTYDVAAAQLDPANQFKNLHDLPKQAHTAFCLQLASVYGLRADPASVAEFINGNQIRVEELKAQLVTTGLLKAKLGAKRDGYLILGYSKDTKAIKKRVQEALGDLTPVTDKGDVSTERTTLQDSGDPDLEVLAEYSSATTRERYYEALETAARVPLNVPSNVLLVTGRTSYRGVIQTFPQKGGIRNCFVPRPGFYYCSVDYSGIELSALAQVCLWTVGESRLAEVLNTGKDAHSIFGAEMGGYSYDEFLKNKKKHPYEGMRHGAKAANFGYPGGMGEVTFTISKRRQGIILCQLLDSTKTCGTNKLREYRGKPLDTPVCADCVQEALKLRQGFFRNWPEVSRYLDWMKDQLNFNDRKVTQFISERVRGGCKFTSGANTLFQGLAADGFKAAIRELTKRMYMVRTSALYGSRLIMCTHDEAFLELPIALASDAAEEQSQVMVAEMKKYIPDVLVQAPPALMTRWYKEAEEVRDASGRLVPWEPKEAA